MARLLSSYTHKQSERWAKWGILAIASLAYTNPDLAYQKIKIY